MTSTTLIQEEQIIDQLRCSSKKQALQSLAQAAASFAGLKERDILQVLLERERLGTTGMGHGVAIPHARLKEVEQPIGFLARLQKPVDFDAVDGEAVDLIFLLLAPECNGTDHLKALAKVSRILRDPVTRSYLRQAGSKDELVAAVRSAFGFPSPAKMRKASGA